MTPVPAFLRSIRFRLALTYSLVLFGIAFLVIAGVNYALQASLDDLPVTTQRQLTTFWTPDGRLITVAEEVQGQFLTVEQIVNQRTLDNLRRYSLWALLGMFPVSLAAGWFVADRTLRPIGRITAVAREIQSTDLTRRIGLGGPDDELRQLADTFDAMLDRLEAGVERQYHFIQDTTHELRNPLAVMATNLDVVLADPEASVEELRQTAQIVRRTVDRTTRTVEELAMYARRDVPQTVRERFDLAQIVDEVVEEYRGPVDEHRLTVVRIGEPVTVDADRIAVKRAVGNLFNNAVRLTPDGATVRIGSGRRGDFAWIGVDDHGPGIDPRDHAAVFQRDWSGDRSSLRAERRTGLGLAIARQIAQAHGGLLTLRSERGGGSAFIMWLPLAPGADRDELSDDGIHALDDPFADPD